MCCVDRLNLQGKADIRAITVVEENNGVFAYPKLSDNAVYINGAESET